MPLVTPYKIAHFQPNAKLIVIFRNPTSATYSSFRFFSRIDTDISVEKFHSCVISSVSAFFTCVEQYSADRCTISWPIELNPHIQKGCSWVMRALRLGRYYVFVRRWMEVFPKENFYFVRFEDYSYNAKQTIIDIWNFLGLEIPDTFPLRQLDHLSTWNSNSVKHRGMFPKTKVLLDRFFEKSNEKLGIILDYPSYKWID